MHRFYLSPEFTQDSILSLTGREAHHALHVLRVRRGERIVVLNGAGHILECEVSKPARHSVELEVCTRREVSPPPFQITLGQAIPKGKLFEDIIQKATELGVFRIVPLITERVVGKLGRDDEAHKFEKWKAVAIEAIKQCGSAWLPQVDPPKPVEQFCRQQSAVDLAMVGSLQNDARHPRQCFDDFTSRNGRKPGSVSMAIGPEGDFTIDELSALQTAGAQPVTFGPLVLRTDTAALYCLSIINYELRQFS